MRSTTLNVHSWTLYTGNVAYEVNHRTCSSSAAVFDEMFWLQNVPRHKNSGGETNKLEATEVIIWSWKGKQT